MKESTSTSPLLVTSESSTKNYLATTFKPPYYKDIKIYSGSNSITEKLCAIVSENSVSYL
jgi:hypothetical protein